VDPEQFQQMQFGGGVGQTILHPAVLLFVLAAGVVICTSSRGRAAVAFLVGAILIPTDQVLVLGSLHFPMLRLLALFGLARILWSKFAAREDIFSGGVNGIDKAVVALTVVSAVDGILLWRTSGEAIYQLGNAYTAFGVYFLLRFLIRDEQDVRRVVRTFAVVTVVVALIMICEQATGKNPLYAGLGGARASISGTVMAREDHFRATGSFAHPILAGTFGGIMLPIFVGLWWRKESGDRKYALAGILSALVLPFAASSSTALFGLMGGLLGLCFWPLRRLMRPIRWAIVITLVSLHLVMKAPVWHLISRVDLSGGSSSYHRYQLINQCILHFWDWMLVGTKDYGNWGWDMWDLSNQYVGIADTVGLIPLLSFLVIIVLGFRYLGKTRKAVDLAGDKKQQLFVWAFCASLFANVVAFFGIGYFDQTIVAWYAILAMICTTTVFARNAQPEPEVSVGMLTSEQGFRSRLEPDPVRGHGSI
jgi:hypothetical protein